MFLCIKLIISLVVVVFLFLSLEKFFKLLPHFSVAVTRAVRWLILYSLPRSFPLSFLFSKASFISRHPEVFLEKGLTKICSKFTREHLWVCIGGCAFWVCITVHRCSPVNLLHFFRTLFIKNNLWAAAFFLSIIKVLLQIWEKV